MDDTNIKLTQKDFDETDQLTELLKQIDHADLTYANAVSDELFQRQPFFLLVILGYQFDVSRKKNWKKLSGFASWYGNTSGQIRTFRKNR